MVFPKPLRGLLAIAIIVLISGVALATEHRGQVKLGTVPVPGAVITATQNDKKVTAITDDQGMYGFPDLADGVWSIEVEMLSFSRLKQDVTIAEGAPPTVWELKMLPMNEIAAKPVAAVPVAVAAAEPKPAGAAPAPSRPAPNAPARAANAPAA